MPFIFPIQIRVKEGQKAIASIIERSNVNLANSNINNFYDDENLFFENPKKTQEITIPRESIFNTSFMYYMQNLLDPFKKWKISFVNRFGQREEGIDAGGLFKEYLIKLSEEAFGNNFNYFIESQSGFLLPNINAYRITNNNCKKTFEFLGFITGKAIFGKQSKLSSSITTNYDFSDFFPPCDMDESQADWGDIYDEYEDFDVCSQDWH
jgi:hypothetical protein